MFLFFSISFLVLLYDKSMVEEVVVVVACDEVISVVAAVVLVGTAIGRKEFGEGTIRECALSEMTCCRNNFRS